MTQQNRAAFVVTCPNCGVHKRSTDPNEAVSFYRRHHSVTGHDIEWERADLDVPDTLPNEDGDLRAVIDALEDHYANGVPIGVITAVMHRWGFSIGEAVDAIYELRMGGTLYEPRDDHLRVT